jgi:hypothetical protein
VKTLRQLAEGKPCYLRLYPFCTHNAQQTVLAHIRRGNTAGGGMKPADINGVPACAKRHAVYDGEAQKIFTRTELDAEMLRAHVQWLAWLWEHEIILVCA